MAVEATGVPTSAARVDVSVIVVTFNSAALISSCIAAVEQSVKSHVAELLVVDNASTDDTVQRVKVAAPEATIIALGRNVGFAAANNVAFERARGRYVALVNSDAFPDPGALDQLIRRADSDAAIGIVGGKLRDGNGRRQPSAGRFPSLIGNLGVALFVHRLPLVSRLPLSVSANPASYRTARRVDWVSGAFCLARHEVGLLPEAGFMYGEDVEWGRQARERGFETWIEPQATAVHLGSGGSESRDTATFRQKSRVAFDLRWFGAKGRGVAWLARAVMVIHALFRMALYAAMLPLRPERARRGIGEFRVLLVAAVHPQAGRD
jgi:GT2 family glycosyltransferase